MKSMVKDFHRGVRPKVLFYSPAADFKGGAERSLMDLVSSPQIDPEVLCPGEGAVAISLRERGIPVHMIAFGTIDDIRRPFKLGQGAIAVFQLLVKAGKLKALCLDREIDYVHSNGLKAHVVAVTSRLMGGRPAIVHMRDIPLTMQEKLVWQILRLLASRLVLVSRACWPGSKLPRRAVVIYNGISIGGEQCRSQKTESLVLGFVGRIHPAKGLHLLIEWLAYASFQRGIEARLVVRGKFYEEARNYEQELSQLISGLGLSERVEFQPFRSDPNMVYQNIDVVCVPSHVPDPLPRAVMEAMARGIPVVAYPAGGIPEMIDDGQDGFLVSNATSFASALACIQTEDVLEKICDAARAKAQSRFCLGRLHREVADLYQNLAGSRINRH